MAGLLSSLTRRELGDVIPILQIEAGARSQRLRAGFQADELIPDFLDGVVEGAYVEGFVGVSEDDGGGSGEPEQAATGGFLIELLFPHDLVTRGTYERGNNWSLDVSWEPL